MITIKIGNILEATENFILHQVNENGIMGGGLALQIATRYPKVEKEYKEYCSRNTKDELLGTYLLVGINANQSIINCFTQDNFNTRYDLMEVLFYQLNKEWGIVDNRTMAIPYKMGCGIANGDWERVLELIVNCFTDVDVTIYKLEE